MDGRTVLLLQMLTTNYLMKPSHIHTSETKVNHFTLYVSTHDIEVGISFHKKLFVSI